MKSRNPIAKNLKINKPKVIPDKRQKIKDKEIDKYISHSRQSRQS